MTTVFKDLDKRLENHIDEIFTLASSIVVKQTDVIRKINDRIIQEHGSNSVDWNNPLSWRFYKHIAGEYHSVDKPMKVFSLDSKTEIDFTKDEIVKHPATYQAYQYGTNEYIKLVNKYPEQEYLIRGIIKPLDPNKFINAEDGTIIWYREDLVQPQELTLIEDLEKWIKNWLHRWNIRGYYITDDYYLYGLMGVLSVNLPITIMNLRLDRILTNEVHEFHMDIFLSNYFRLDKYITGFDIETKYWLYRHIRYLTKYLGSNRTFELLLNKLLKAKHIWAGDVKLIQQMENNVRTILTHVENLLPEENKDASIEYTIDKILDDLRDNEINGGEYVKRISINLDNYKEETETVLRSITDTKEVVSNHIERNTYYQYSKEYWALMLWPYMAANGYYNESNISILDKNGSVLLMDAEEAFIYFFYCYMRSIGIRPTKIRQWADNRFPVTTPNRDYIVSLIDENDSFVVDYIDTLIGKYPVMNKVGSKDKFIEYVGKINDFANYQWLYAEYNSCLKHKGYMENVNRAFYTYGLVTFRFNGQSYDTFTDSRKLYGNNDTSVDWRSMALDILKKATGIEASDVNSFNNIITIMRLLSSYTTQYIDHYKMNNNTVIVSDYLRFDMGSKLDHISCYYTSTPSQYSGYANIRFCGDTYIGLNHISSSVSDIPDIYS